MAGISTHMTTGAGIGVEVEPTFPADSRFDIPTKQRKPGAT